MQKVILILSVNGEYLWTSAIVSDCKDEFTWCAINEKVTANWEVDRFLEGTKCLAVTFDQMTPKSFNCSSKKLFACEVVYI